MGKERKMLTNCQLHCKPLIESVNEACHPLMNEVNKWMSQGKCRYGLMIAVKRLHCINISIR